MKNPIGQKNPRRENSKKTKRKQSSTLLPSQSIKAYPSPLGLGVKFASEEEYDKFTQIAKKSSKTIN